MTPRRTEPAARLPADLAGPVDLALARSVETIPGEAALLGGSRHEPKWDGFRASILRGGDTARIWSRQRKDLTDRFPDIAAAGAGIARRLRVGRRYLRSQVTCSTRRGLADGRAWLSCWAALGFRVYDTAGEPMRVQRVAPLGAGEESRTVLGDDWRQVVPVEQFLSHLTDQGRSPNTVKAYEHDLKDYFEYLTGRGLGWDRLRYDELAAFKPWLRLPAAGRRGEISVLPATASVCSESTINRKLSAVTSFYDRHHEVPDRRQPCPRSLHRALLIGGGSVRAWRVSWIRTS